MNQNGFIAKVKKTKTIQVNENTHNLPPDCGDFAEYKVADYHCPDEWSKDGVFIPVKEGDPMWFDFRGNDECAIIVSVQRLNPVTNKPADLEIGLSKEDVQNYLSMPKQKWIDGYVNDGKVYQFIVTKQGIGLAVNEYVLPKYMQDSHALGFAFFGPKNPKPKIVRSLGRACGSDYGKDFYNLENCSKVPNYYAKSFTNSNPTFCDVIDILEDHKQDLKNIDKASMGQGGRINQRIISDDNTIDYYHEKPSAILTIYMALPEMFKMIVNKGKRQDSTRKDKFIYSGKVNDIQVPLIVQKSN